VSKAQTRVAISLPGVYRAEIVARCDYPVHYWELHIVQGGPDARYAPAAIELSPLHVRDICGALRRAESRFAQLAQMTRDSDYIEPVFSRKGMSADIVASNGALQLRLSFQNRTRWVFFTYVPVDKIEELRSGFESAGGRGVAAIIDLRDAEGGCITADRKELIRHHGEAYSAIRAMSLRSGGSRLPPDNVDIAVEDTGWIYRLEALYSWGDEYRSLGLDNYSQYRIWSTLAGDVGLKAPTTARELTELYAERVGWHVEGACSAIDMVLEPGAQRPVQRPAQRREEHHRTGDAFGWQFSCGIIGGMIVIAMLVAALGNRA
jgi:hypothetical protein